MLPENNTDQKLPNEPQNAPEANPNLTPATQPSSVVAEDKISEQVPAQPVLPQSPVQTPSTAPKLSGGNIFSKIWVSIKTKNTVRIPLAVLVVVLAILAIPVTRYSVAGLVVSSDVKIKIVDKTAGVPVSDAVVTIDGKTYNTGADGVVLLNDVKPGNHIASVSKNLYTSQDVKIFAPIFSSDKTSQFDLVATGRQVKVTTTNKISGQVASGLSIEYGESKSKTGSDGSAILVVPDNLSQIEVSVSGSGYNTQKTNITVNSSTIAENKINVVPEGSIYFLSKLSGKIDVVKTNLDGTGRTTILAGTGKEKNHATYMLPSDDNKYLALVSNRSGKLALYLIETSTSSVTTLSSGSDLSHYVIGWSGSKLAYYVRNNDITYSSKKGAESIKVYNASSATTNTIVSTDAGEDEDGNDYYQEISSYDVGLVGGKIFYTLNYAGDEDYDLTDRTSSIYVSGFDGSPTSLKSFTYDSFYAYTWTASVLLNPSKVAITISISGDEEYYTYDGSSLVKISKTDYDNLDGIYAAQSPDHSKTLWSESRDGKNTILLGNANAGNEEQLASLSDYDVYGWASDDYILLSKDSSALYITTVDQLKANVDPIKVTNYYPYQSQYNYGYYW